MLKRRPFIALLLINLVLIFGVFWLMLSLRTNSLETYEDSSPPIDLRTYFDGDLKAWGLIQDWRGRVTARFDVDMKGSWQGDEGRLDEVFYYYDSERVDHRTWLLTRKPDGSFVGRASDIVGDAKGQQEGSALAWAYDFDLQVKGRTHRVRFDDWMWQMNDGILINRSYIKKFGFTVAELTLFMQKQPEKGN